MRALKLIIYFILAFIYRATAQNDEEEIIFKRISLIYKLKDKAAKNIWISFSKSNYNLPLIYYTDSSSYVANPSKRFLAQFPAQLLFNNDKLKIFKTTSRIDRLAFHMEVSLTMGSDTNAFDYHYPFVKCSGLEESKKMITDLNYNAWLAMIIHECFHVFQYNHKPFAKNAFKTNTLQSSVGDSLQNLYKKNAWFRNSIDEENKNLLLATTAHTKKSRDSLISNYLMIREKRRTETKQILNLQIDTYEKTFETLEGTARYIEAATLKLAYNIYGLNSTTVSRPNVPGSYIEPAWLYSTEISDRYFYATGYNVTKLLDKLSIQYKTLLFANGKLTLEDLLRDFIYKKERK